MKSEYANSKGFSLREIIVLFTKFFLFGNAIMTAVLWQSQYRNSIQSRMHVDEYLKIKVLIDSTVNSVSGFSSGQKNNLYSYYSKPKEGVVKVSAYPNNQNSTLEYYKLISYKESHHDSINVWYHPLYKNYYAEEYQVSVKEAFNKKKFIKLSIFFYVGVLTIIYIAYILIKAFFFNREE